MCVMTPEEFIKRNPFPKNGAEINKQLVRDIQDPSKAAHKTKNLNKLLKNNARLIYVIYRQYNYAQTLSSIMSFVFEGLKKATETYDFEVGMPFYHYAVQTIRGLLQNYYNYNNDLIHIPVMKKKKKNKKTNKEEWIKVEYSDINDYLEHQYIHNNDEESLSAEMDMLIEEYESQTLSIQTKEDLSILKMYRQSTLKDLSNKTGINTVKLRKIIDKTTSKLRKFYCILQNNMSNGKKVSKW